MRFLLRVTTRGHELPPAEGVPTIEQGPEPHVGYYASKRALDLLVAAVLLVCTVPIWLTAILLIVLDSGRPVMFRQRRLGYLGHPFVCLKLRTMVPDAETRIAEAMYAAAVHGPEFKRPSDPRVTRLGRLLRVWSVDELPQLINVLRGEMSIVGPRPLAEWEAEHQGQSWQRLSAKPGLTGTWQVSGRSEVGWEARMEMDAEYVQRRSLAADLSIMLRTPRAILSRRGAA